MKINLSCDVQDGCSFWANICIENESKMTYLLDEIHSQQKVFQDSLASMDSILELFNRRNMQSSKKVASFPIIPEMFNLHTKSRNDFSTYSKNSKHQVASNGNFHKIYFRTFWKAAEKEKVWGYRSKTFYVIDKFHSTRNLGESILINLLESTFNIIAIYGRTGKNVENFHSTE